VAKETPTKRRIKKTVTVRERAEKAAEPKKARRMHRTARTIGKPFRKLVTTVTKALRPLGFLLRPFRTRPARVIGKFFAKLLLFRFFAEAWRELKEVNWPTRRETIKLTFAVFIFAFVFSAAIGLVDFGLDKLFKALILQ
jgi:preprotein translocase SecE subunit